MTVDTDNLGFVYVAGGGGSTKPVMAKLFPNGLLDNTFNLTGKLILDINGWDGSITKLHVISDGKIIVTGSIKNPSSSFNNEFFAAKINPNGTLDTSFNGTGYKVIPIDLLPEQSDESLSSTVLPDGSILITGATINGLDNGDYDIALVKLNPDGSHDNSFGINGTTIVTINSGDSNPDAAFGIDVQGDAKILLCGFSGTDFNDVFPTYIRLLPDGSRDFSFGSFGVSVLPAEPTAMGTVYGQTSGCLIDSFDMLTNSSVIIDGDDSKFAISRVDLGLDIIFKDRFE